MAYVTLTKENFEEEVLRADKPVLVDFWAGWCSPCMALAPTVDEIADEAEGFKVGKVNVDDQPLGPAGEDSDQGGDDMPTTLPEEIDQVMEELYDFLALFANSSDSVNISTTGDGRIFISFQDAVFFDGDKSVLRPEGKAALDEIIPALEEAGPYLDEVKIMGHTAQARPDQANTVRGDRTLSTQRAAEVLIYIQEHSNGELLDPARLTSEGYGQWQIGRAHV